MNERIKELVEQAGIHFRGHRGSTLDAGPDGIAKFVLYSDMERFAALIVKECAKAAGDFEYARLHDSLVEDHVLKHFGVEE